uniref:Uncharacterized protein n=1 Tax=Arundo donax TaxID=35708 RepID=A0A0A9H637_ARUDO
MLSNIFEIFHDHFHHLLNHGSMGAHGVGALDMFSPLYFAEPNTCSPCFGTKSDFRYNEYKVMEMRTKPSAKHSLLGAQIL